MTQNTVLPQFPVVLQLAGNDSCEFGIPQKYVLKSDFEACMLLEYFKEFSWGTQQFWRKKRILDPIREPPW
jgi:hypothetical protein